MTILFLKMTLRAALIYVSCVPMLQYKMYIINWLKLKRFVLGILRDEGQFVR